MREIKFKIFPSKKMLNLNGDNLIGRKSENITTRLKFIVDENLVQYYNYIVLTSPSNVNYLIELVDFHYDVKQWITNEVGAWQIEYVSTSQENLTKAEDIDAEQAILISNTLVLTVEDCNASGELFLEPGDAEQDLEDRITIRLEGSIDEVAAVVDTIEEQILGIIETEGDISGKLTDVLVDLSDVKSSLTSIGGKVDGVDTKLTPIANNITSIKATVEAIPTNDYTSDFSGIVDELGAISDKIDNIIIDFTPVLNKLNTIESKVDAIPTTDNTSNITSIKATVEAIPTNDYTSKLNGIENKIDLIPTTDNSEDIASIKETVESIPTNDYTSDLASIETKVDNIPTNDYSSDIASIKGSVEAIPTNDYTNTLTSISNKVDAIPTTDNTNNIASIKQTVESIPTNDYTTQLNTIEGKIDDIPTTDYSSDLASIEGKVDLIPTNDYTTKLNGIENKIDVIPTTDNTSNISSIKTTVEAIPTNDYTSDLASIEGKVDLIPTNDYTTTLATMQTSINGQGGLSSQIGQQTSLINSISQDTTATNNRTATMATDIASIKTTTQNDYALEQTINAKVGDNDTKADGTLFNYAYWSLQRANEAKANAGDAKDNTVTILSDLATMQDDITYIKNNIGGGGHESWTFPSFDYMFATDGNDQTGGRITIANELLSHSSVPGKIAGSANYLFYMNRYITAAQINAIDLSGATYLISAFSQIANPQNLSASDTLTLDLSSCVSMAQAFEGFGGVSTAVGGVGKIVFENSGNVDNWGSCFYNFQPYTPGSQWGSWALNLTDIEIDLSGANSVYNMFTNGVPNLVNLTINGSFGGDSTEPNLDPLDLSTTSMTYASVTAMLTNIEANNSGYTRTFNLPSSITIDQTLTDIATSKNYTLTQV